MWIFNDRKTVLSAQIVRHGAELAPCSVGYLPLIMFCLKSLARVEIYVIHDYMIMDMVMVYMDS